jgi:hypothetical protein
MKEETAMRLSTRIAGLAAGVAMCLSAGQAAAQDFWRLATLGPVPRPIS